MPSFADGSPIAPSDRDSNDVVLACGEAVDNAFEHGRSPVTIELSANQKATWRSWSATTEAGECPCISHRAGLGLPIMTALMDNVTIDTTNGTALRLSRRLSSAAGRRIMERSGEPGAAEAMTDADGVDTDRVQSSDTVIRTVWRRRRQASSCRRSRATSASPGSSAPGWPTSSASASTASTMCGWRSARRVASPCTPAQARSSLSYVLDRDESRRRVEAPCSTARGVDRSRVHGSRRAGARRGLLDTLHRTR